MAMEDLPFIDGFSHIFPIETSMSSGSHQLGLGAGGPISDKSSPRVDEIMKAANM
jgi:hypothetical protein